mgnify:CR=1 FL=1
MDVSIDRSGCISCELCAQTCPAVFRMADDGLAEVYAAPSEADVESVLEAADNCPVQVIEATE